ncbi:MAG TPA: hypothetical protein PLW27_11900, partial [Kiritimatiellia bacterium]|nr:hypothetical protein [Kiritimatiellia bacterium]
RCTAARCPSTSVGPSAAVQKAHPTLGYKQRSADNGCRLSCLLSAEEKENWPKAKFLVVKSQM